MPRILSVASQAGCKYYNVTSNSSITEHVCVKIFSNCLEDIDALGGVDNLKVHTLDINFNLIPCPTPAPTAQPTPKGICKRVNTSEIDCVELDGDFCPEEIFIPGR
uniref:Uncharacterized protein n=1 Tax=Aplanochytrium stocchinoi TaxID=215587 RepID=A0A7S3V061_9STRA|mmetsp:Transcript_25352/g.31008  ORF Transcript_25352/g.31008 Transcript_25352/m.31008 type:complete len:106 (-) Transcript_25352:215-532(-)